jgi:dTDP-4-dehydrorhamnose reductase
VAFGPHVRAHTDLEYRELNQDDADRANTLSVEHASTIANKLRIPLVYKYSGIFDGAKLFYDDWDQRNPLGIYPRTKYG